jgi:hypothetical protein
MAAMQQAKLLLVDRAVFPGHNDPIDASPGSREHFVNGAANDKNQDDKDAEDSDESALVTTE